MSLLSSIVDVPAVLAVGVLTGILLGPAAAAASVTVPGRHWPWQMCPRRWVFGAPATGRRRMWVTGGGVVVVASLAVTIGWRPAVLAFLSIGLIGVMLAVIDLEHHRLPDRLTGTAAVVSTMALLVDGLMMGSWPALLRALVCAVVAFVVFLGMALISPEGMGFGDVKLAAVLSLHTGWLGWQLALLAVLAGFTAGALAALTLLLFGRVTLRTAIPFGPGLLVGAWLVVVSVPFG